MTDPCPNRVFDPTPDWASVPGARRVVYDAIAGFADIPAENLLLPLFTASFEGATFLVLHALGTV